MAAILVDYENVNGTDGLKGVQYLTANDSLNIFYSQCCGKIRADYMAAIEQCRCDFQIRKLVKTAKNGLDFYIAVECGILNQKGETQIAIISRDKGFGAILDFFKSQQESGTHVVQAPCVESGLQNLSARDDEERRREIANQSRMLPLEAEYARLDERKKIQNRIRELVAGTELEPLAEDISDYYSANKNASLKPLYTESMHRFGRSQGTKIYRVLKLIV